MQLNNPFQMNDWEIREFLTVVLSIQFAMWGAVGLDAIGLKIPIIRQLVSLIFLTLIPGILILRILKLHKLGNIETLLYSVGLSIAALMFTGLLMNTVYPFFGFSKIVSLIPLTITISAIVLVLSALSYIRDKDFADPAFIDLQEVFSPSVIFLCLIPLMALFGTFLVNFYQNNILLMLMLVVIAIDVVLIALDKSIPKSMYPLAVFMIAISLLYHGSLISMYIWGSDIHVELYYSNLIMKNFHWDITAPGTVNAMLSIVMLAPIYSNICCMSLTWVFKIIYPLLFAFVPLGLYHIFQKQTSDKTAFLSCFFFMSIFTFYTEMLALARQQIAEIFLVLLVLLMVDKKMDKAKRSFLFIIFSISLAVSHYGLSYIYMLCLIFSWLMLVLGETQTPKKLMRNFYSKFGSKKNRTAGNRLHIKVDRTISSTFVLIFITFTITWYMYISSSSAFNSIVNIGNQISGSIFTEFLSPKSAQGLDIILAETASPLHNVAKYLHLLFQFFIFAGLAATMMKYNEKTFEREYEAFSLLNFAICVGGIALPYFAGALNTTRLYHITLIFLAPYCVIGGTTVYKMIKEAAKACYTNKSVRSSLKAKQYRDYLYSVLRGGRLFPSRISLLGNFEVPLVISVLLAVFLLFNSGWAYEIANDNPGSIALSQESINMNGNAEGKVQFYNSYTPEEDVFCARWLSKNRDTTSKVYADRTRKDNVLCSYGMMSRNRILLTNTTTKMERDAYIYLGRLNVVESIGTGPVLYSVFWNITEITHIIEDKNKIYSNSFSEVHR